MISKELLIEMYKGVTSMEGRHEGNVEHHPRSVELAKHLEAIDFHFCDDALGWNFGGDGDNGEVLLDALDMYFDRAGKLGQSQNAHDSDRL